MFSVRIAVLSLILAGCSVQLYAVRGTSKRDGVEVSFCGADHIHEDNGGGGFLWTPGGGGFIGGGGDSDTGYMTLCLHVVNNTDGKVTVDRRRLRLLADGYRGLPSKDGQENVWPVEPGEDEQIEITFHTDSMAKDDNVRVSLAGVIAIDGAPVKLAPLRLSYKQISSAACRPSPATPRCAPHPSRALAAPSRASRTSRAARRRYARA